LKAIVHIGTEKTGTTSIQSFLYENRAKLRKNGFHFLQCAGKTNNRAIPTYCMSNNMDDDIYRGLGITSLEGRIAYKRKFIEDLENELANLPSDTRAVLISSEHFHSRIRTDEELDNVHKLLSNYFSEFEIICYLRDQITTCTSCYSTALKSGNSSSFLDFIQRCKPTSHYYNYWGMLQSWEQRFGPESINVSLFSIEHFLNGNLLDDFTAKFDPQLVGKLNTNIPNENESLNPSGQALSRAINLAFPVRSVRQELRELREECQRHIAERHRGRGRQLSADLQPEVFAAFAEMNEALRKKYFPDEAKILEPPALPEQPHSIVMGEFLEGFQDLLDILHNSGRRVVHEDEYLGIYNILFSCINELLYKYGEMKLISALNDADVRVLRDMAFQVERFDVPAANMLLESIAPLGPAADGHLPAAGAVQ